MIIESIPLYSHNPEVNRVEQSLVTSCCTEMFEDITPPFETYSPAPVLRAWDRSLGVRGRSQSNNHSGTGPRVFF